MNRLKPALLRQATYGTIKIGIYHSLKRLTVHDPKDEKLITNVFCGIIAGVVSSCIANPTDVLKVRMQAQSCDAQKLSLIKSFSDIAKKEGVAGLWRVRISCKLKKKTIQANSFFNYSFKFVGRWTNS